MAATPPWLAKAPVPVSTLGDPRLIRGDDDTLPSSVCGLLEIGETKSAVGEQWTDDGEVHETRGLKR
ncbi:hypothetical protein [Spirillospora sp. NPDC048819]|uniref:hypothetical protein n=1 Tax=Spirillospora sp. NPDC048819 TaxID=3155268 RepID=UPI0033F989F2